MQLYVNSLMGTREMDVLRSLWNPEEMDDAELRNDLRDLGKKPSFDGKDSMLVSTAVDTRETICDTQTSRKDILKLSQPDFSIHPGRTDRSTHGSRTTEN